MGRRAVLGWISLVSAGLAVWMVVAWDFAGDRPDLRVVDPSWLVMMIGLVLLSAVTGSAWAVLVELGRMQGEVRRPWRLRFRSPVERVRDKSVPERRTGRYDSWS